MNRPEKAEDLFNTFTTSTLRATPGSRRRAGAAMIETVLALPFLVVILGLVFLVGQSMMRLQHVSVADRYEAWRRSAGAPGPAPHHPTHGQMRDAFMPGAANAPDHVKSIDVHGTNTFPSDPVDVLRDAVSGNGNNDAEQVMERALERLPNGQQVRVEVTFDTMMPLEREVQLAGPMVSEHVRLANDWRFANGIQYDHEHDRWEPALPCARIEHTIRDVFLESLDTPLAQFENDGNGVARTVRRLYLGRPGYRGPYLDVTPIP